MSSSERARGAAPGRTGGSRGSSAGSGRRGEFGGQMLLLLLLLLGLLCELPSAGALKEQKAEESQPGPLNLTCKVSSHPLGLKIIDPWLKPQVNTAEWFKDCQELSSFLGFKHSTSTEEYCDEMVNTSSKSQESILLKFIGTQANSTRKLHENIMVTCTSSCFSPQNTFSVNCTLKHKPFVKDNGAPYECPEIKPSALLSCQEGNSTPTSSESVDLTIAMSVIGSILAIVIAAFVIYWLRWRRRQRNPQQSVHLENYSKVPTESTVAGSDV